ncbi:unnamed protein product [Moneuplotes crassus]|uniref:Uncharacterized protein n=1 Tax=Euplotes crassus TaxID=5936 RepID=A0AAD1U0L7_EUPCR|nr:unnamed protein product [Moneuplotes crassus]
MRNCSGKLRKLSCEKREYINQTHKVSKKLEFSMMTIWTKISKRKSQKATLKFLKRSKTSLT